MFNLATGLIFLLLIPAALIFMRRIILARKKKSPADKGAAKKPEEPTVQVRDTISDTMFPPVQTAEEDDSVPKRTVPSAQTARHLFRDEEKPPRAKVGDLPPLKRAVVWSEILGPPKCLRDTDTFSDRRE